MQWQRPWRAQLDCPYLKTHSILIVRLKRLPQIQIQVKNTNQLDCSYLKTHSMRAFLIAQYKRLLVVLGLAYTHIYISACDETQNLKDTNSETFFSKPRMNALIWKPIPWVPF